MEKVIKKLRTQFHHLNPWVVGSYAKVLAGHRTISEPNDIDIIIPSLTTYPTDEQWYECNGGISVSDRVMSVIRSICKESEISRTYLGGTRCFIDGIQVEIWEDDIAKFLCECPTAYDGLAFNLLGNGTLCTADYNNYWTEGNYEIDTRYTRKHQSMSIYKKHLQRQGL